nr:hypothetical protein [uncultured Rhodoferax sp.]
MTDKSAPKDFPRRPDLGSIGGAQLKVLATKFDGRFVAGQVTEEEVSARWTVCEDLVQQLATKTARRKQEGRIENLNVFVNKLQQWLESQVWDGWRVTGPEARWMRDRIKLLVEQVT